ncbi:MAG: heat-inducible transcriptional repressor HrcA [Hyphomicrobiales bacterium]|nr:heat-inducible transcriptional repressor HrcA [Hyphomicrobiales bacterium]
MNDASPRSGASGQFATLDARAREVLRRVVEFYVETGEPLGSRNLARALPMALSPASVRNVMQDLETLGLVYSPHVSAGRLPTERGLRFFVDTMLQVGDVDQGERRRIERQMHDAGRDQSLDGVLAEAGALLSGVARGAGVVLTAKENPRLKHVEFVRLDPSRALAILVGEDGAVENRVVPTPPGLPASALVEAGNWLAARVVGRTLAEARSEVEAERRAHQGELDALAGRLVDAGLAAWADAEGHRRQLIVRGQSNLLEDVAAVEDVERLRKLFADLERRTEVIDLLERAEAADGVRIYIGSENRLFSLSGSSTVAAPFRDAERRIVGVVGVIGPTRLDYARVVPMVDYTARLVGEFMRRRAAPEGEQP